MNITTGKKIKAQRIVIYGVEGIGKSEMASRFPDPVFLDTEGSTNHLDVSRLDAPTSWAQLMEQIRWISNPNNHSFKTFVLDTIDWAERLCAQHICQHGNVAGLADFGWHKGFVYLAEEMGRMLDLLTHVTDNGINVVILGHSHIRKVDLPEESGSFDKYELRLEKKVAPLPKEWADAVIFCNFKTFLVGETKKKAKGGRRVICTKHHASYDAKNRYGMPDEIDFEGSPQALYDAIAGHIPVRATGQASPQAQQQPVQQTQQQTQPQQQAVVNPAAQQQVSQSPVQESAEACRQRSRPTTQAPVETQPQTKGEPTFYTPLFDLMDTCEVWQSEIEAMAVRSGHFPEGMKMGEYPQDYLEHLVGSWNEIFELIKQHRGQ